MEYNNNNQHAGSFEDTDSLFKPIDIYFILKANWYWFVLAVIICMGYTAYQIKKAPKIYIRTASLLIKDNNSTSVDEAIVFKDANMFQVQRTLENEILIMRSKQLMEKTVQRLNLNMSYSVDKGLRFKELYTQSPIILDILDANANNNTFSLTAIIHPPSSVELSHFSSDPDLKIVVNLNDSVITPIGKLVLRPTLFFSSEYAEIPIFIHKQNMANIVQHYRSAVNINIANEETSMINLSLMDVSPIRAEDVLNTLIATYIEETINRKNQIAINTASFIQDRLILIEKELGTVDEDIASYKSENKVIDVSSEMGMYLQENRDVSKEALDLDNQLKLAKYVRQYLTDPKNNSSLIPANTLTDANIEGRISVYNSLFLEREKLINNSSDNNPVVMDINVSLQATKQNIIQTIDNHILSVSMKIQNNQAQEYQTNRLIAAMPAQQKAILPVERQQKIKEGLYLYLLNQREKSILSQAITESDAQIIDNASGPNTPIAPNKKKMMTTALIIGLAIPACILWLINMLNTRVHSRRDLEKATTIPFLGEIPLRKKNDKREIVIDETKQDFISEAFRIIRTNMDFMQTKGRKKHVVMFTSFNSSAGKTFISSNLAMSFTFTNKKVILVDLDIRKGSLSRRINSSHKIGMTNYLSEMVDSIDDIIVEKGFENKLDVILAGSTPPNPTELLLSNRLETLIDELKKRYDYIFLDNVPAGVVADASIVSRIADFTIYVIRAGKMDRRQLPELESLYRSNRFRHMCLILNGMQEKYQSYGYYGYGYGYGYNQDDE